MTLLHRTDLVRVRWKERRRGHLYVVRKVESDEFHWRQRVSVHLPLTPRLYVGRDGGPIEQDSLLPEELQRLPTPAEASSKRSRCGMTPGPPGPASPSSACSACGSCSRTGSACSTPLLSINSLTDPFLRKSLQTRTCGVFSLRMKSVSGKTIEAGLIISGPETTPEHVFYTSPRRCSSITYTAN